MLCLLIGGSGVGYVWQKNQIYELGRQIARREARLKEQREQNEKFAKQLEIMRSPRSLESRIKELNLGLSLPQPAQVLRLPEPAAETNRVLSARQYAAEETRVATSP